MDLFIFINFGNISTIFYINDLLTKITPKSSAYPVEPCIISCSPDWPEDSLLWRLIWL